MASTNAQQLFLAENKLYVLSTASPYKISSVDYFNPTTEDLYLTLYGNVSGLLAQVWQVLVKAGTTYRNVFPVPIEFTSYTSVEVSSQLVPSGEQPLPNPSAPLGTLNIITAA